MSSGPTLRPATPKKKPAKKTSPAGQSLSVNVILDTKARREYPKALTHAEVKCPAGSTIKFILDTLKEELGKSVPVIGVRRLKDSEKFTEDDEVASVLTAGETVVAYCADKPKTKLPSPKGTSPLLSRKASGDGGAPSRRGSAGSGAGLQRSASGRLSSPGRKGAAAGGPRSDHLARMSEAGKAKNASFRDKEKKAAEIKAKADEEEAKKFKFSPKTNVITKRKNEEKLSKAKRKQGGGGGGGGSGVLATLLSSGGWVGEMPLPNSYDAPAKVVAVFVVTSEDRSEGGEIKGYLRFLGHGDLAGPEGLVVHWCAWLEGTREIDTTDGTSSVTSSRSRREDASPNRLGKKVPAAIYEVDFNFPPSLSAGPVPALLRVTSNTNIDIALPLGEKDGGEGAPHPSGLFGGGSEAYSVLRPTKVDWPNQIMALNLVSPQELEPPVPKILKLGTSLKNVAMSIVKEIKKLIVNALKSPSGRRLREGEKKALVVVRLWNIRVEAKIDVDPFWTLTKLRVGIARLYERFPLLAAGGGEMNDPVWLAQAMEDEKDGRLRDKVVDTLEELVKELDHCDITYDDQGEHTPRITEDTEVFWFTGNSNAGLGSPLGAYLASNPSDEGVRKLRLNRLAELGKRPSRPCDLTLNKNPAAGVAANAGLSGLEDLEPRGVGVEKGGRGKLIMAAERNKKALDDGTYGQNPGGVSYQAGQEVLGRGNASLQVDPSTATVNDMRCLKLELNQGRSLADEEYGSKAEAEASTIALKRKQRAMVDPSKVRAARLKASAKWAASMSKGAEPTKKSANDTLAQANKASVLIEMKMRRLQLHTAVGVNATRKRSRPEDVAKEAKAEAALLSGVKLITDPAEKRRLQERILAARKRKLMDFLPSGSKAGQKQAGMLSAVDASAAEASSKMEAPLGGGGKKGGGMGGGMTEEEKEMLAILKGINTSSSDKFADSGGGGGGGGGGSEVAMKKTREKIKDYRKKSEIAKMRLAVIVGDDYAKQVAASKKVTLPVAKLE